MRTTPSARRPSVTRADLVPRPDRAGLALVGYRRGVGKLIRLCLWHGVEPVFIPLREPWRNGAVEKFDDHWGAKFVSRVHMATAADLARESLAFDTRHNLEWRYSGLAGKTPMQALAATQAKLRFPPSAEPPRAPLPKPERGRYHVVQFIRSDRMIDIVGERFLVPPDAMYAYVGGRGRSMSESNRCPSISART